MRLYYRSDTRSPSEIFAHGFTPKADASKQSIFGFSLALQKKPGENLHCFKPTFPEIVNSQAPYGADPEYVVCISKNYYSSAIFPFNETKDSYIYTIIMPEAIDIELDYTGSDRRLPRLRNNCVYNLQTMQIEQAKYIKKCLNILDREYDPLNIGWPLYANECFTKSVDSNNIVCAMKIIRNIPHHPTTCTMLSGRKRVLHEPNFLCQNLYTNHNTNLSFHQCSLYQKALEINYSFLHSQVWHKSTKAIDGIKDTFLDPSHPEYQQFLSLDTMDIPFMDDSVA